MNQVGVPNIYNSGPVPKMLPTFLVLQVLEYPTCTNHGLGPPHCACSFTELPCGQEEISRYEAGSFIQRHTIMPSWFALDFTRVFSLAASTSFSLVGINFVIGTLLWLVDWSGFSLEVLCLLCWKLTHWKSYEIPTTTTLRALEALFRITKRLCIFGPKGAIQIRYYYY